MATPLSPVLLKHFVALVLLCATTRTSLAHLIPNPWPKCSAGYCERLDNHACMSCSDAKAIKICNFADCRPRNRSLKDVTSVVPVPAGDEADNDDEEVDDNGTEYTMLLQKCGVIPYDTFLYVDSHLFATAVPQNDKAGCPVLVVHAIFENQQGPGHKEMRMFSSRTSSLDEYQTLFPAAHSKFIGAFNLSQLAEAYGNTNIDQDSEYNVWNNNCGSFLVQLASHLNVSINTEVATFVARRLWEESSQEWVDSLRETMRVVTNHNGGGAPRRNLRMEAAAAEAADEEIVELLVNAQASSLY